MSIRSFILCLALVFSSQYVAAQMNINYHADRVLKSTTVDTLWYSINDTFYMNQPMLKVYYLHTDSSALGFDIYYPPDTLVVNDDTRYKREQCDYIKINGQVYDLYEAWYIEDYKFNVGIPFFFRSGDNVVGHYRLTFKFNTRQRPLWFSALKELNSDEEHTIELITNPNYNNPADFKLSSENVKQLILSSHNYN